MPKSIARSKTRKSVAKRFKGSDRMIISPMQVLMHKTYAVESAIAENDVKKALAVLAGGDWRNLVVLNLDCNKLANGGLLALTRASWPVLR